MPTVAKLGKRDRPSQPWYLKLLDNLHCQLTWFDLLIGFGATAVLAALLVGFHYRVVPDFKLGEIADQDVRAMQDVTYEDSVASAQKREIARNAVPALYQLDTILISNRESEVNKAFAAARGFLAQKRIPPRGKISAVREKEIVGGLESTIGSAFPPQVLPILLHQRFSPVLEAQILKILDSVLRSGIVSDRAQFMRDQRTGIVLRDSTIPFEHPLADAYLVRDLPAGLKLAKEIGLAQRIRDMIPQHHGTRIMTYFYEKAKNSLDAKNQEVVEADFRYPGPKPQSKEAAIMMMADSVEAASRTLTNPPPVQIQGMINRLIDAIVADNQFDECDITLHDVRLVKESFFKTLTGIYHRRIDYPGYDFKSIGNQPEKALVQD